MQLVAFMYRNPLPLNGVLLVRFLPLMAENERRNANTTLRFTLVHHLATISANILPVCLGKHPCSFLATGGKK